MQAALFLNSWERSDNCGGDASDDEKNSLNLITPFGLFQQLQIVSTTKQDKNPSADIQLLLYLFKF